MQNAAKNNESHFATARAVLPSQGGVAHSSNQQAGESFRASQQILKASREREAAGAEPKSIVTKANEQIVDRMTRLQGEMAATWGKAPKAQTATAQSSAPKEARRQVGAKLEAAVERLNHMFGFDVATAHVCFSEIKVSLTELLERSHFTKDDFVRTVAEIRRALDEAEKAALK